MLNGFQTYKRKITEVAHLAVRHIFPPINLVIFSVVILLVLFGNAEEGIFLGIIIVLNIFFGFIQDVQAWLSLERLQVLTAVRAVRLNDDGNETMVFLDEIRAGDRIKIKLGDQVPCDSIVLLGSNIEVNEGLITGESELFPRKDGESVFAGSIVASGSGVILTQTAFAESRIAKMTQGLKRYSANPSPIQLEIGKIIRYTVYVLFASIVFIVARGALTHESSVRIVETIGALASVLVPQGLVVSTTLLFTFGAMHFYRRHVLLQEVNAVEKFGLIKNLCIDKTGTLTENVLVVERMEMAPGVAKEDARKFAAAYAKRSDDASQAIQAIELFLDQKYQGTITDFLPFSSWRKYGGISLEEGGRSHTVFIGAPDILLPHLAIAAEKKWLEEFLHAHTDAGKYILCMVSKEGNAVAQALSSDGAPLSLCAVFVLGNKLREGIRDAIDFFQSRGVSIRILSGDNPETARVIASAAGVNNTDKIITGAQMERWNVADYAENAKRYTIFARILPEQKERIIEALKIDGFTAMVGDGANDALSVKKADLGIAMFDGTSATRQIAAVVLTHNSFVELPGGVRLADSMIESIEIYSSIFLNQTFLGFFSFALMNLIGYSFPLTPLNITFINYLIVGLPYILISYWALRPLKKTMPVSQRPFLKRVVPFPLAMSIIEVLGAVAVFVFSAAYLNTAALGTLFSLSFIANGYVFFLLAPRVFSGALARTRKLQVIGIGALVIAVPYVMFKIPFLTRFFNIPPPPLEGIAAVVASAIICGIAQYIIARRFFWIREESVVAV